jgi:hypothetical protein
MNITSDIVPEVQPGVFTYELYTILSNFESANLAQVKYVRKQTPGIGAIFLNISVVSVC